jgi:hypothetical protein
MAAGVVAAKMEQGVDWAPSTLAEVFGVVTFMAVPPLTLMFFVLATVAAWVTKPSKRSEEPQG